MVFKIFTRLTEKNIMTMRDPGYHTSPIGQEFLAETYYQLIKDRWNLV
jgi:hypothetical protein